MAHTKQDRLKHRASRHRHLGAQVTNNRIESYAPGMIVGANVDAAVPFRYPDMVNIAFIGNKVVPCCAACAGLLRCLVQYC